MPNLIKVSDLIVKFFEDKGVENIFLLSDDHQLCQRLGQQIRFPQHLGGNAEEVPLVQDRVRRGDRHQTPPHVLRGLQLQKVKKIDAIFSILS